MNKIIIISVMLIALTGCSKKSTLPTQPQSSSLGKIYLNIDTTNAPNNVVTITAILTRDGYDTLSASYNVIEDSTASLSINNIPAGNWLLTVNALDGHGTIVYSGNANVSIMAGITEQISLALTPTGEGFGNIIINVTWGQQIIQGVLQLDGSSGYVEVPNSPSLTEIDTAITIEAWVKPFDDRYYNTVISKGVYKYGIEFAQGLYPGIFLRDVNAPDASYYWGRIMVYHEINVNQWIHIAVSYSPSTGVNVYYNEQLMYHTAASGSLSVDDLPLRIGARLSTIYTEYFGGSMDDIRIWNLVRTQNQIIQNMNHDLSGNEPGLVADWKFNRVPTSNNVIYDSSPNHNNGVIHGGAKIVKGSAY